MSGKNQQETSPAPNSLATEPDTLYYQQSITYLHPHLPDGYIAHVLQGCNTKVSCLM